MPTQRLFLSDPVDAKPIHSQWMNWLVALGASTSRYRNNQEKQLVISISVPQRDYAAALIAAGHVLATQAHPVSTPECYLRTLEPGAPVRFVNREQIRTDTFYGLQEENGQLRAKIGQSIWLVQQLLAIGPLEDNLDTGLDMPRPNIGPLGEWTGSAQSWDYRLANPIADLAILGTQSWIDQELDTQIGLLDSTSEAIPLRELLLPYSDTAPTWYTKMYSTRNAHELMASGDQYSTVILDGNSSIDYLIGFQSNVVFCILDRSNRNETGVSTIIQQSFRGDRFDLEKLCPNPPLGIETLTFTVEL